MRPIIDSVVKKRIRELGFGEEFLSDLEYTGNVCDKLNKISLKPSDFGFIPETVEKQLDTKYRAINISGDTGCIQLVDRDGSTHEIKITRDQLRMLKALVLEQVNPCMEYTQIITIMFWQLVAQLASKRVDGIFKMRPDATKLQTEVIAGIGNYLRNTVL